MAAYEEDLYDDLAYEDIEGAADLYDEYDEYDEFDEDEYDEYDEMAEFDGYDEFDEYDELEAYDDYDGFDEYDEFDDFDVFDEDDMDEMLAYALGAEDTDEFFKRLLRGVRKVAKKATPFLKKFAKGVGSAARIAGPILNKIPLPYAQLGGRVAGVLGKLLADGADEDEMLDAMAEYAAKDQRALPIVATIAARNLVKSKGAQIPKAARKRVVKQMKSAAKTLVASRGKKAIRALPKIVKSVKRKTAMRRVPATVKPKIVKRTVSKVVRSPVIVKKLARPSPKAVHQVRKAVRYSTSGPARISIRPL